MIVFSEKEEVEIACIPTRENFDEREHEYEDFNNESENDEVVKCGLS